MRAALLATVLLAGVALVPAAPATHGCHPGTSPATLTLGSGDPYSLTFYVAVDSPFEGEAFIPLPWIYQESNGAFGLQRHDDWRDDTCRGEIRGDLLVF